MAALEACTWRPRQLDLSDNTACAFMFATSLARCLQCVSTYPEDTFCAVLLSKGMMKNRVLRLCTVDVGVHCQLRISPAAGQAMGKLPAL